MTILAISKARVSLWLFVVTAALPFALRIFSLIAGEILALFDM